METFSALLALYARGIHRSPGNYPYKSQWRGALMFSLICTWTYVVNKRLSKQWWSWWLNMPSRSLWRHCNGRLMEGYHNDFVSCPVCICPIYVGCTITSQWHLYDEQYHPNVQWSSASGNLRLVLVSDQYNQYGIKVNKRRGSVNVRSNDVHKHEYQL